VLAKEILQFVGFAAKFAAVLLIPVVKYWSAYQERQRVMASIVMQLKGRCQFHPEKGR
jgi:hypothetical protein